MKAAKGVAQWVAILIATMLYMLAADFIGDTFGQPGDPEFYIERSDER